MLRPLLSLSLAALLGACATLPRDGPSARSVSAADAGYALVELDAGTTERLRTAPTGPQASLAAAEATGPVDVIGIGDTLAIAVYEPGGGLFTAADAPGGTQSLPPVVVDRAGSVSVPFAGPVRVAGLTAPQAADAVRRALSGRAANPQVVVTLAASPSNSVTVLGEVRTPGRAPLTVNSDRLLDVIAAAGGASRPVDDVEVVVRRGDAVFRAPLAIVASTAGENVRLAPGDEVNLAWRPRRFSTFGAVGQAAETDMGAGPVTLASALARAGGLNDAAADARSVLVFRFERPETAAALGLGQPPTPRGVPVVYRLDLAEPSGFFVAGQFLVQPGDVIYAPRAGAAEMRKFFEFVQSLTRVVYDISVTSALNLD